MEGRDLPVALTLLSLVVLSGAGPIVGSERDMSMHVCGLSQTVGELVQAVAAEKCDRPVNFSG